MSVAVAVPFAPAALTVSTERPVSRAAALIASFDTAVDSGGDHSFHESKHPGCVETLKAWASARALVVRRDVTGSPAHVMYRVAIGNGDSIIAFSEEVAPSTRPSLKQLAERIRDSIDRQVDTTEYGQRLTAFSAADVEGLIGNIVGNVAQGLVDLTDEMDGAGEVSL